MGGFAYLIAGRYAMDQGVVAEECNPYDGSVSQHAADSELAKVAISCGDESPFFGAFSRTALH